MKVAMKPGTTRAFVRARSSQLVVFFFAVALLLSAAPPVYASDPIEFGYRGPSYPGNAGGNGSPTGEKPESKLWWHDGSWWASMWSGGSDGAYHIYRLNAANIDSELWFDTEVELDDRRNSRADVLADGDKLYVASHVFAEDDGEPSTDPEERGRLYRYSYDSGTYSLDDGFPVEITGGVSETLVLEKDAQGKLWVTYVEDKKVMVNHSVQGDDTTWVGPYALPVPDAENLKSDDISSIITYNVYVGIMWSKQQSGQRMYFAVHHITDSDDDWDQVLTFNQGDDHINLTSLETDGNGRVYGVVKTAGNDIILLVCQHTTDYCTDEGNWSAHTVFDDHSPTRAMMLLDTGNDDLYVFSRNKEGGRGGIYYKRTDMDTIQFDGSIGTPFIRSADNNEDGINDPTSTKQNLTAATGLMVLASDSGADHYFYNYLSLSGSATEYTLTVNVGEGGNVSLDPPGGVYDEGTSVSLTATADAGWQFVGWGGDLSGSDNPTTIEMDGDKEVTATFIEREQYDLTLNTLGDGSINLDPSGGTYYEGTEVELEAVPDAGQQFAGWSGALTGNTNPATLIMDGDKSVTATFEPLPQYTLTDAVDGGGSINLDPPGGTYYEGTEVELEAVPDAGQQFVGWSGALTGNTNPATLIMDGDKSVTATFAESSLTLHTLTVDVVGQGSVTPDSGSYEAGTVVTLTATADVGWQFSSWGGAVSGTNPQTTVIMDGDKSVTATFTESSPTLHTLTVNIEGPGTVDVDPPGGTYPQGSDVVLTAVPAENWAFGGWGGDLAGNTNPITLTMDSDKTITASFFWPEHLLTVNTLGSGSVTLDPPQGPYTHGEEVTLTAVAEPGWTFNSWSGDLTGTENPATVVMDAAKEINATFVQKESGIQINVSATPLTATVGQVITYTYVVANIGEATLNDVAAVDDHLGAVTLDKTTLVGGETAVGRLTYTPVAHDLPGPLQNIATVTATSVLDEVVGDDDSVSVALEQASFIYYLPFGLGGEATATGQTGQNEERVTLRIRGLEATRLER